jgi:hypothetical protein
MKTRTKPYRKRRGYRVLTRTPAMARRAQARAEATKRARAVLGRLGL